ncbi:hypothetical protein ExPCM32_03330 [Escherichia coli]|nr:hypothetical protein ExPCM32_03330 [Escherichia coli]
MLIKPVLRLAEANLIRQQFITFLAGQTQYRRISGHAGLYQGSGQPGTATVGRNTVKLFGCTGTVEFVHRRHPGLLGCLRPFLPGAQTNAPEQPLRYGFPESDAMYAASLTSGTDIPDKRIERIVVTVMGGDNAYLSPPDKHRQRRFQQFVQLLMERRFINDNNPLTTTQVRRAAGERNHAKAGLREPDGVSFDVFVVVVLFPESFFNFTGCVVEYPCPHGTGLDIFDGHVLVISDVIHIHPACWRRRGGGQYVIGCLSPCNTGTTALFYHLKRRGICHPALLVGQQNGRGLITRGVRNVRRQLRHDTTPRISRRSACTASAESPPLRAIFSAAAAARSTLSLTSA